jgi:hypothetical protein
MSHIRFLIAAAIADNSNPPAPKEAPPFDEDSHKRVGILPFELRRVFVLLQNMTKQNTTQDKQARLIFDSDLTKGHLIFHTSIAEIFRLKLLDEVVICQDWVVAVMTRDTTTGHSVPVDTPTTKYAFANSGTAFSNDFAAY